MTEGEPPIPPADPAAAAAPAPAAAPPAARRRKDRPKGGWQETKGDLKWAAVLLLVLILTLPVILHYVHGPWGGDVWHTWSRETTGEEDLTNVTHAIFSQGNWSEKNESALRAQRAAGGIREPGLVVPFEVLSVLLLAALIAGVVIAFRERKGDL